MSNNPMLNYKPGLTMDEPVTVTMAAADWAIFMAWFANRDDVDGIQHILYGVLSAQVADALYSPASLKAAQAHFHDHPNPVTFLVERMGQVTRELDEEENDE